MKRIFLLAAAVLAIVSCNNGPTARITATIDGLADSSVVLQKLNYNKLQTIDTISTDGTGSFTYKVKLTGNAPYFYYIYSGEIPVASMVLLPGDKVLVKADSNGRFSIEGSEESVKLQQVNDAFAKVVSQMTEAIESLPENPSAEQAKDINRKVSKLYVDYKRDAVKYVINNPYSITSAIVLFQKYNDRLDVFSDVNDALIFRRTLDSLATVYPKSDYVLALRDAVSAREAQMNLNSQLANAGQISFPYLSLPDQNGVVRNLNDYEGNVIILSFWSVGQNDYKMFNNELVDLYNKYHSSGLEIYQVGLDIDKPSWASVVKKQNMPFLNVNDGLGVESPAVSAYNVGHIPSLFVIDRQGNIVARDVFDSDKLEAIVKSKL